VVLILSCVAAGVDNSNFADLSSLMAKEFSLFDPLKNATVRVQWCFAVSLMSTSNASVEIKRGDPFHAQTDIGHNYGYYIHTLGSGITMLDKQHTAQSSIIETGKLDDFVASYEQGDQGFPCAASPRNTKVYIRCRHNWDRCWDSPTMDPEKSNQPCTALEWANGGCMCGFLAVPPCTLKAYVLVDCGSILDEIRYSWLNLKEVLAYAVMVAFGFVVLTMTKAAYNRGSGIGKVTPLLASIMASVIASVNVPLASLLY